MATLISNGSLETVLNDQDWQGMILQALEHFPRPLRKVLLLPPDYTRLNSQAGRICAFLYKHLSPATEVHLMPALGTHTPMPEHQIKHMFGDEIPADAFKIHDWRNGVVDMGEIPAGKMREWSEGKLDSPVKVEVDKIMFDGYDLILSVGQIVPHEVVGMANYTKNILVGVGGRDTINNSHFLGAVYGMERIMGRIDTPVRKMFNYGVDTFLGHLPIWHILTVVAKNQDSGGMDMKGLYIGNDMDTFAEGARLSQKVNLNMLEKPLQKVVVYLDPHEFKSTWLGNKAVYRTRMAIADNGELIILAPALKEFGEDPEIDRLIRKYGYHGTPATLEAVRENQELRDNLSAAAHLIHGSSEGRFRITYCPGPGMSEAEIRGVGFDCGNLEQMLKLYNPEKMRDGMNVMPDGEEVFFISNPGLGLWSLRSLFERKES